MATLRPAPDLDLCEPDPPVVQAAPVDVQLDEGLLIDCDQDYTTDVVVGTGPEFGIVDEDGNFIIDEADNFIVHG